MPLGHVRMGNSIVQTLSDVLTMGRTVWTQMKRESGSGKGLPSRRKAVPSRRKIPYGLRIFAVFLTLGDEQDLRRMFI